MKKSRVKKPALVIKSMTDAENILAEYATADARRAELQAKLDQRLTKIREEYADDLQELGDTCEQKFNALHTYFEGKPELFKTKKSLETAHGIIGFRTGTPKLKLFKSFNWSVVAVQVKKTLGLDYIRTVEEVNKEALLSDREQQHIKNAMTKDGIGCYVDQDESFFIELKKEEVANAN